jgi:hypothetical protein
MAKPCELQRQLAESTEAIVEQILAYVLTLGENEDA